MDAPAQKDRSLKALFRAYQSEPHNSESLWQYIRRRNPHLFSHHPPSACFREHVWHWKGLYWCKGCVVTALGMAAGLLLQLASGWLAQVSEAITGVVFVGLIVPTVLTASFNAPRPAKHAARFLLGVVTASAFLLLFVTESWLVRGVVVFTFFAVRIPLEKLRKRTNRKVLSEASERDSHRKPSRRSPKTCC